MKPKTCGAPGCQFEAIIRIQPLKKPSWDYWCHVHWITLCMAVVQDADHAGILDKLSSPPSDVIDEQAVSDDKEHTV